MEMHEFRRSMKALLSDNRYKHSIGVEEVCYDLALIHEDDTQKARIAGILHDCAKYLSDKEIIEECEKYSIIISELERNLPLTLLHSKLGAVYAKGKYGINDEYILDSIRYHTTGRPAMTKLDKILYVADFIEPNRNDNIPNINYIREVAYHDLDKAVLLILNSTINYLVGNKLLIDGTTVDTYEYYVNLLQY